MTLLWGLAVLPPWEVIPEFQGPLVNIHLLGLWGSPWLGKGNSSPLSQISRVSPGSRIWKFSALLIPAFVTREWKPARTSDLESSHIPVLLQRGTDVLLALHQRGNKSKEHMAYVPSKRNRFLFCDILLSHKLQLYIIAIYNMCAAHFRLPEHPPPYASSILSLEGRRCSRT